MGETEHLIYDTDNMMDDTEDVKLDHAILEAKGGLSLEIYKLLKSQNDQLTVSQIASRLRKREQDIRLHLKWLVHNEYIDWSDPGFKDEEILVDFY